MQPMGRKPIKLPSKQDCAKGKNEINWWEYEIDTSNKSKEKYEARKEIEKEIMEYLQDANQS